MRKIFLLFVTIASVSFPRLMFAQVTDQEKTAASRKIDPAHQKGDIPIIEGHELHKVSIYLTQSLSPGRHDLGTVNIGRLGPVRVWVTADKAGEVTDIQEDWPKGVKPEMLSFTSHPVYVAGLGGLQEAGKSHCQNKHAGGSCDGCSTYIWVEVTQFKPGVTIPGR